MYKVVSDKKKKKNVINETREELQGNQNKNKGFDLMCLEYYRCY